MIDHRAVDEAALAVMECEAVWRTQKIPAPRRSEMREELTGHLVVVLEEGGTVNVVVRPDAGSFASEWGGPHRPTNLAWLEALDGLKYSLLGAVVTLGVGHLRHRSPAFPYDARRVGGKIVRSALMGAAVEAVVRVRAREQAPGLRFDRPLWKDTSARVAGVVAPWMALLLVNAGLGSGRAALSEWSWRSTTVVLAASAFLLWRVRDDDEPGLYGEVLEDLERRLR